MIDKIYWATLMDPAQFTPMMPLKVRDGSRKGAVQFPMFTRTWGATKEVQAFYRLAYNKESADCAVRALAVACAAPYKQAHKALADVGRVDGGPADVELMQWAAFILGYRMVEFKPHGKTLRTAERILKDTKGGYVLTTVDHAVGLWDGEMIDFARGTLARVKHAFILIRSKK